MIIKTITILCESVCLIISVLGVISIVGILTEIKRDIKGIEDKLYDIEKWLTDREGEKKNGYNFSTIIDRMVN